MCREVMGRAQLLGYPAFALDCVLRGFTPPVQPHDGHTSTPSSLPAASSIT